MNRRQLIKGIGAGLAVWSLPLCSQNTQKNTQRKFIWIVLRGGMDALHAVVPMHDPDLERMRGALIAPIADKLLPMDGGFALHPSLTNLHHWYRQGDFSPVVATASSYRQRSHFQAQDYLESGLPTAEQDNGWLARALALGNREGLAIARSVPLSLRGQQLAKTWYPLQDPDADGDMYERLMTLYETHPQMQTSLQNAIATQELSKQKITHKTQPNFAQLARYCAKFLKAEGGPDCAMLELNGWDTHSNLTPRLNSKFKHLDQGLGILKQELGELWGSTMIAMATEFGRTVAVNGTRGTDHGTASVLFLAGGAIKGGQILGEWPGLAKANQLQGRDLRPTSDTHQWLGSALCQHWKLNEKRFQYIFPNQKPSTIQLI